MNTRRKSVSSNKKLRRKGGGLLNTLINKLPVELHIPGYSFCGPGTELHIPGYSFCGPGTKLRERLERGDKGVNLLDAACKEHDIAYSSSRNLSNRHVADEKLYQKAVADEKLYQKAVERFKSKDASVGERLAASVVAVAMKGKTKLGMGLRRKRKYRKKTGNSKKHRLGGALSFAQALRKARNAIGRSGKSKSVLENARVAYHILKKSGKRILAPRSRVIAIPKKGGFLPLIPLFATFESYRDTKKGRILAINPIIRRIGRLRLSRRWGSSYSKCSKQSES
ncbi:Phospholipase A2-like domain [Popillia japonica]|uniref:Phospholipase A2-like domain n=1 Tax=Popillia japonica TaxID=7064 RepID=A0AAW1JIN8_POPJA